MSLSLTPIKLMPNKRANQDERNIQMSNQLVSHLHLQKNRELHLTIGKKTITALVQISNIAANEIHIPDHMLLECSLPIQTYTFHALFFQESHTLKLGPVIGLLTDFLSTKVEEPHFRTIHLFCEELHHGITEQGGFFYVFSYDNFPNLGYYLNNEKWIPLVPPLPDVIYNRIHSRKLEQTESFKNFRQKLDQLVIPFFNDRFLSKWEVYEKLTDENQLHSYIPETKIFSKDHLYDFAKKYETIFLKPIHGSQGKNIFKLKKDSDCHYTLQTSLTTLSDQFNQLFSLDEIYQQIKPLIHNRIYVIQQGISFLTNDCKAMDFRVLCHKTQMHHWAVTSTVARIASETEFVSNLARGGTITRPLNALRTCMSPKQSSEALFLIKELALETAAAISRHSKGITGELGIDIGVDYEGKPWLIEVNSKPSKNFEDGLGKIRPSAKAIIQFCTILAFEDEKRKRLDQGLKLDIIKIEKEDPK